MALTKITAAIIEDGAITASALSDNSIGITQLNVSDGTSGQFLKTDGSGNLSFASVPAGYTDSDVESYLSGGTGVTFSSGVISIGQDVGTSSTPTFGNTITGTLQATSFSDGTISGITFIDEDSFVTNSSTRVPTQQSIKAYVDAQVAGVVDSAPAALDTLNELAAALGDDANFSTTTSTALGNRLRVDTAAQGLTGTQQANAITNLGITATKAELNYVDGVTSNIQTQLNGKQATGSYLTGNQTITLSGDASGSGTTSIAVTIADDSHNHIISNVDGLQTALDAKLPLAGGTVTGDTRFNTLVGINKAVNSSVGLSVGSDASSSASYGLEVCNASSNTRFLVDGVGSSFFYKSDNAIGMKFDGSTGNVGIGTTSPAHKLDFGVTSLNQQIIALRRNSNSRTTLGITGDYGVRIAGPSDASATGNLFEVGENSTSDGTTFLGSLFSVQYDGSVGIGTTSPSHILHISGTGDKRIKLEKTDAGGNVNLELAGPSDSTGWLLFKDTGSGNNSGVIKYVHNGDYMSFRTNGTDDRMRITSNGNIGIGTSSPSTRTHIYSSASSTPLIVESTANTYVGIKNTTQTAYIGAVTSNMIFENNGAERMRIDSSGNVGIGKTPNRSRKLEVAGTMNLDDGSEYEWGDGSISIGGNSSTDVMTFATASAERMRIDSAGNVGIGVNPVTKFHVRVATNANFLVQSALSSTALKFLDNAASTYTTGTINASPLSINADSGGQILMNTTDGNMPTAGGNADVVIYGGAGNGFAYNALHVGGGRISLNAQPNSNSTRGYLECSGAGFKIWHVDNSDMIFGANNSEKMRIQQADGRIRSQPTYDNAAPATHRDVYVENSGQLGYASSVRAHKTNITDYGDASWLYSINPKTFNYRKPNTTTFTNGEGHTEEVRDGTYSDTEYYDNVEVGFIAEDVEEHDPNLCFYNEIEDEDGNVTNELAGIHYKAMVAPMLKLIKEQKTLIDNLTTRIETLEG